MYVEYSSNNSGGDWWLDDAAWKRLENAGWKVEWASLAPQVSTDGKYVRCADGTPNLVSIEDCGNSLRKVSCKIGSDGAFRYMGALATTAYRIGLPLREAAAEWERVTGASSTDAGCPCCGQPHNFTEYDDNGQYVSSGPDTCYEASW